MKSSYRKNSKLNVSILNILNR